MKRAEDVLSIVGGAPVEGRVTVRGAKNSVPKSMVAALLTSKPCRISNIAEVRDIDVVSRLITALGGTVARDGDTMEITADTLQAPSPEELEEAHGQSRIPILICGPLLHRLGAVTIHQPGGCEIGPRPIDMHLDALKSFGAVVEELPEVIRLTADRLRGCKLTLPYPSVGATEQVLLTGVLAEGETELSNAAVEPEILDLILVLQKMGAIISVQPGRVIHIDGTRSLRAFTHRSMPDRLEASSWACAALATNGCVSVSGVAQLDMMTFLNVFRKAGGEFDVSGETITFYRVANLLRPLALETDVHPGFMTDWQPPLVTALTQAQGVSVLHETVYENRLGYTHALNSLGANIQTFRECLGPSPCRFGRRNHLHSAVVVGQTKLQGGDLYVPDLRGGFSYVIAALVADGVSRVHNARLIERGYESFRDKLVALGVELL
ncbi:MAG: UDP-N-acetylglucosamine 1-carboxyvinyltransferase [Actinomycetota bacterium]|nr:UDP-N-acetylglucosamine 1-carboxyvinyltransferase [Actinomycetota bacterium]